MDTRKIALGVVLMLGLAGIAMGQCTLNVTMPYITDTSSVTTPGTTSTVDFSTLAIQGGGLGPGYPGSGLLGGYNAVTQDTGTNPDIKAHITSVTGGTKPESGIFILQSGENPNYVIFSYYTTGGVTYYKVAYRQYHVSIHGQSYTETIILGPTQASGPVGYMELLAAGTAYSAKTSSDGINWTTIASGTWSTGTVAGVFADAGDTTAGNLATAIFDHLSVNGALPSFSDADAGNTGGNVGGGEPNIPLIFKETVSGLLTYTTTGTCTQTQLNAISSAENNGHYAMNVQEVVYKNNDYGHFALDMTNNGQTVCAQCSEPSFDTVGTANYIFTNVVMYVQDIYVQPGFDLTFTNALTNANVQLKTPPEPVEWEGHRAISKAYNEYTVVEGPPLWTYQMGPYPTYACSSASVNPDFKPFEAIDDEFWLYYKGTSYCKRPKGSPSGTGYTCQMASSYWLAAKGTNDSTYIDCTNFDRGVKGRWP